MRISNKSNKTPHPTLFTATMAGICQQTSVCCIVGMLMLFPCLQVAGSEAQAIGEQKPTMYRVTEVTGDVSGHAVASEPLQQLKEHDGVPASYLLEIGNGGSLKLKLPAGSVVALQGPMKGSVDDLVKTAASKSEHFVRQTLRKIPDPQNGQKKVEISTPPAGLTKAAKIQRKPMPYIWKVKQAEKKTEPR